MSKKTNPWVTYVKDYSLENNIGYGCALSHKGLSNDYKNKKPIAKYDASNELQKIKEDYNKKGYHLTYEVKKKSRGIV